MSTASLPVTVLVAAKNEEANLPRCLASLALARAEGGNSPGWRVARVVVLDSHSADRTAEIARGRGAEVVQFDYRGGSPKKRQWALDNLEMDTPWVLLLDADEAVPEGLWAEMAREVASPSARDAYLITKGFHFLGKPFRFGGFSHAAVLLFRRGKARFEQILTERGDSQHGLDMEVHERLIVAGRIGKLRTPLIHEDFKGLQAYIDRHNRYSTWEAAVRWSCLRTGRYGQETIRPRLFGNTQERRRFLKTLVMRLPFEPWLWFSYHYLFRLGFLEGRRGLIASQIRASYISQCRAKVYEMSLEDLRGR
jgi:glycosyltransferase involved in cell wall biosynthesis